MAARDLAPSSSATAAAASSSRSGPAAPPSIAARYRSLFVIGQGGMGAVEAALELHAGGSAASDGAGYERVVALKRLLPDAARDARRVEMFLREAKLATMLDHPNVVRAYDYGQIDGELFLAMEYVEGQALSRVLKTLAEAGGELGASLTAHVLAEVCDGLHAAHELHDEAQGPLHLVHRDVSPQNMMLGYDGHVHLLDFGVAKIEAESVTKTGEVKGKTAYMSPEQAMGDAIDRRSDLFGVGAVLFECLALRRMWGDGTDMDVIRKLALEEPPRLGEAVPSAPPALCALYMRLVGRDAKDRPATARDVAEELRELVPQGRDEAARALRRLLDTHFGAQAEEQRRRLTTALEEVAPEQARELRESVSPELAPLPSVPRARASTAHLADATGANPVSGDEGRGAGVAAMTRDARSWPWVAAFAVAVGGAVMWKVVAATDPPAAAPDGVKSRGSIGIVPLPPPSAPAPSTPAPALPSAPASASASASAPASAFSTPRVAAQPAVIPRPSLSVAPTPVVAPSAATHAKPPPDVDDHPF